MRKGKDMKNISIRAFGAIPVGEHWEKSLVQLSVEAIQNTLQNVSVQPEALYVGNMLGQTLNQQDNLAAIVAESAGLDVDSLDVNSGENSGLMALKLASMAVASGEYKNVLVLGVEKTSDRVQPQIISAHASGLNHDYETSIGATQVSQSALLMQRYLYETECDRNVFEAIPINGHRNAVSNQNAMYRKPIREGLYARMGVVSSPLNMFDVAPYADGAACLLITSEPIEDSIQIKSIVQANDTFSLAQRDNILKFDAVKTSSQLALEKANIKSDDIDFHELDDFTSIQLLLSLEAVGLAKEGKGHQLLENGKLKLETIPVCTLGGSKARGYPIAATGIYQIIEAIQQLKNNAADSQVNDPKNGLVQALSGMASSAITCILSNEMEV